MKPTTFNKTVSIGRRWYALWLRNQNELRHYGVKGMKWGVRNGPPYPIARDENGAQKKTVAKDEERGRIKDAGLQFFAESDIQYQKSNQLRKGIKSLQKRITEHQYKIAHPEEFYDDWGVRSEKEKSDAITYWKKEIKRYQDSIDNRLDALKSRGEEHE